MEIDAAIQLIAGARPLPGQSWADLGAGGGTFTRALARLLAPNGTVYAVERDEDALRSLRALEAVSSPHVARVVVVAADFTEGALDLPEVAGALLANALHFVPYDDQPRVLASVAAHVAPAGRIVLVEYDRDAGNPWVPYPISRARLSRLAKDAGLAAPAVLERKPSAYGGALYSALIAR